MGVLTGIRVLEFEAIGPGPFGTMLLADMGADVIRIDRPVAHADLGPKASGPRIDITGRGRRSVTLDLKQPAAVATALELIDTRRRGDRRLSARRDGAAGPRARRWRSPATRKLVYGRMTGWGQTGPLAERAGHDLNYIALSGVLSGIGRAGGKPTCAAQPGGRLRRWRHAAGAWACWRPC